MNWPTFSWAFGGDYMGLNILIIKLDTFGMAIHHNCKSLSMNATGNRYVIIEEDGSQTSVAKDNYMLTILK